MSECITELRESYRLLEIEYTCEKELYEQKSQTGSVAKRIEQGLCWFPISIGRSHYNSLNQLVLEILNETENDVEHTFEYGRPVCFFIPDTTGKQQFINIFGTINLAEENRMLVSVANENVTEKLRRQNNLGIQLYFDATTYKAMFEAMTKVINASDNRLAELRNILLGVHEAKFRTLYPVCMPWLNSAQEKAVNRVLSAHDTAIVHGPPGTGKTTTLVEAIYETLRKENQILICAQSNTAVDWISEKLLERGINVLRIGNPTRINNKILACTYEKQFEAHSDYPELWSIRKKIREKIVLIRQKKENYHSLGNQIDALRHRATELEITIEQKLFREARIVASTLTGASSKLLENKRFSSLFIDEAAQALEASCWIAISHADRVIFAGDYKQLPPVIKSQEAINKGLDITLMEKVANRNPQTVSLLETQYRMHKDIMAFPSHYFYNDRLKAAPEAANRCIFEFDTPLVWFDTTSYNWSEHYAGRSTSKINKTEANYLLDILQKYINTIGIDQIITDNVDFGIISPYKAQVQYIRSIFKQNKYLYPLRKQVSINTVDGFQGQERDVIILSLVRSNDNGNIGFLNDLRRINVAITRARMKLILVGNSSTLTHHPFYKELYQYINSQGIIITANDNEEVEPTIPPL